MIKPCIRVCALAFFIGSAANGAESVGSVDTTVNPEDCEELIEHAQLAKASNQALGHRGAEQVTGGDQTLEDESCLADVDALDIDFFSGAGLSSIYSAAIKALADSAKSQLDNLTCAAVDEVRDAAETALSCDAAVGLSFDIGAGFDDLNVDECLNYGEIDYTYDGGEYGLGDSDYSAPFDGEYSWGSEATEEGESNDGDSWSGWFGD